MKDVLDAEYTATPPQGVMQKMLTNQHRRLIDAFASFRQSGPRPDGGTDTLLDVVLPETTGVARHSLLLSHASPGERARATSFVLPASDALASRGAETRHAGGRHLPFEEGAFDWVFCGDMLQRCGGFERQYELLSELCRVARKGLFVTTPNRWHPLDLDTGLPFLHWLPGASGNGHAHAAAHAHAHSHVHSHAHSHTGETAPTRHLQDRVGLRRLCALLPGRPAFDIGHLRIGGIKAHYFLLITKTAAGR